MDYMITHLQIPKMIAVLIDPDDRNRDYTIYEPYFCYVTEELMPFVEDEYMNDGFERSVMGVSWGGLAALYLAFQKPHTFQKLLTQSGSYWPHDTGYRGNERCVGAAADCQRVHRDIQQVCGNTQLEQLERPFERGAK
jgi:enterochelin esterase family protein